MIDIAQENKKKKLLQEEANDKNDDALKNLSFEVNSIDSVQVDKPLDVIMGMSIMHLLPNRKEMIQKVYDHLKPGGYFISSTICMGDFTPPFIRWMIPIIGWTGLIPKVSCDLTKQELRQNLEQSSFNIEREFHPANDKAVFFVAKKKEKQ